MERSESGFGFVGRLYYLCQDAFEIFPTSSTLSSVNGQSSVRKERERLRLWGDGFKDKEGGLDSLLGDAGELRDGVVEILSRLARKLRKYLSSGSEVLRALKVVVAQAEFLAEDESEAQNDDTDADIHDEDQWIGDLEEIKVLIDCLYELVPYIETVPMALKEKEVRPAQPNDWKLDTQRSRADTQRSRAATSTHIEGRTHFTGRGMTGIEVVGLALGLFPLVVQAAGFYFHGIEKMNAARYHKRLAKRLIRRLEMENIKFENTCESFLMATTEEVVAMVNKDCDDTRLRDRLETCLSSAEAQAFESAVQAVVDHLQELGKGLGLGDDHRPLYARFQWEKIKSILEQETYVAPLEAIRQINEDLAHLTKQRTRTPLQKPTRESDAAKNYNLTRDRAQSLYKVLQEMFNAASCHCRPNASLQLDIETLLDRGEVRFKVLFNFDVVPPTEPIHLWSWRSLEFRSADVAKPTSALNPDEIEDQPGKERSFDSPQPRVFLKQKRKGFKALFRESIFGKKKVSFEGPLQPETSLAKFQLPPRPKVAETLQRVKEICPIIKQAAENGAACLGFVADDEKGFWHLIWPPKNVPSPLFVSEPISLEALLFPGSIEERNRLELGVKLASAVLQLHGTQWLKESWGIKDIFFLQTNPKKLRTITGDIVEISAPELKLPFVRGAEHQEVHPLEQTDEEPGMPALMEYDKSLFSLGIVLIELYFEKPFRDLRADSSQCQGEDADFQTAQRHIGDLFRRAGLNYGLAVSYCINGGKEGPGLASASKYILDDVNFKNAVHDNVVCLLQKNLEVFSTAYGED